MRNRRPEHKESVFKGRLFKAAMVFLLLALLALAYAVGHKTASGGKILRKKGGSQAYHVKWGKEEFDITVTYRKKGKEEKSLLGKPKKKSLKEQLTEYVQRMEKQSREEPYVTLPTSYRGKQIHWQKKRDYTPVFLLVLGIVLAYLTYKESDWEKEKEEKKRRERLMAQYPELVGVLTTFLDSGMSIRYAIVHMTEEGLGGNGPLQAELVRFSNRLKRGESLIQALQSFAKGCGTRQYRKFASLLLQNLEKGNDGLRRMLEMEVQEAEAFRLSFARRKGEQAQTKVLLPLTLLLGLVIAILMAPAFLQIKSM